MALNYPKNPPQIILLAHLIDFEGKAKENVTAATVRVFHMVGAIETVDLAPTALTRVGISSAWRYVWGSPPLPGAGAHVVEYTIADSDGVVASESEDLIIEDVSASLAAMDSKIETLLDVDLGEWIFDPVLSTWTLKTRAGGILKVFDVKDHLGQPATDEVFRRIPLP